MTATFSLSVRPPWSALRYTSLPDRPKKNESPPSRTPIPPAHIFHIRFMVAFRVLFRSLCDHYAPRPHDYELCSTVYAQETSDRVPIQASRASHTVLLCILHRPRGSHRPAIRLSSRAVMMILVSILRLASVARAAVDTKTIHIRSASRGLRRLHSICGVAVGHVRIGCRRARVRRREWALKL